MSLLGANARINIAGNELAGANDCSVNLEGEVVDITTFKGGLTKKNIKTLKNFSLSISGIHSPGDTAYDALLTAANASGASAKVVVQVLTDGTNGFSFPAIANNIDLNPNGTGGVWQFSVSLSPDDSGTGMTLIP